MAEANEETELGVLGVDANVGDLGARVRRGMKLSLSVTWLERAWIFGLGVLIARGLTETDYAAFGAALAFVGVLITADDLGMLAAVVNHRSRVQELAPTAVTVALLTGSALFVAFWFAAPSISSAFGVPDATDVFRIVGVGMLADAASIVPNAIILRELRQGSRSIVVLARLGLRTVVTVAVLLTLEGAYGVAWAYTAGELAALVLAWAVSPVRPLPGFDRTVARSLLSIGIPVSVGAAFTLGTFNIDNLIVGNLLGAQQLAYYLIAFNAASWLVNILGGAITQVGGPALAEYKRREQSLGAMVSRSMVWLLEVALPASALLAALADPLVRFLYGERYAPAVVVLQIIAALGVCRLVVNLGRDGLVAEGHSRTYAAIQISWAILVGIGVYIGASVDGLSGAAIGHDVVAVIVVVMTLVALRRHLDVHPTFLRSTVRPALGAVVGGLGAWFVSEALESLGMPLVQLGVGGTVGTLLCFVVGFSTERRGMLLQPFRRRWTRWRADAPAEARAQAAPSDSGVSGS